MRDDERNRDWERLNDREERLNFEGALELCHQVGLPIGNADDLDALVAQIRTANVRTLEALQEMERLRHERDLLAAAVRDAVQNWTEDSGGCHVIWARDHIAALDLAMKIHTEKPAAPAEEK